LQKSKIIPETMAQTSCFYGHESSIAEDGNFSETYRQTLQPNATDSPN